MINRFLGPVDQIILVTSVKRRPQHIGLPDTWAALVPASAHRSPDREERSCRNLRYQLPYYDPTRIGRAIDAALQWDHEGRDADTFRKRAVESPAVRPPPGKDRIPALVRKPHFRGRRQLDEFTLAILKSHRSRIGTQRNIPSEWNSESHLRRACHSVIANGLICR